MKKLIAFLAGAFMLSVSLLPAGAFFNDVAQDAFYYDAVNYLSEEGIVTGYTDGSFGYDLPINRAELLTIVIRAAGIELDNAQWIAYAGESCFDDVSGEWYTKYICLAKDLGWVGGYEDGTYLPGQDVNFVEVLKITMRAFDMGYDTEANPWYKDLIDEASSMNLIPLGIDAFDKKVTRGEMSDLIARIMNYQDGTLDDFLGDKVDYIVTYETIEAGVDMSVLWDMPSQIDDGAEGEGEGEGIYCDSESDCPDPIGMGCYDHVCWDSDPCVQCSEGTTCMKDGSSGSVSILCLEWDDYNLPSDLLWSTYDMVISVDDSGQVGVGYTDLQANYTDLSTATGFQSVFVGGIFLVTEMAIGVEYVEGDVLYFGVSASLQGGARDNYIMEYDVATDENDILFQYMSDVGDKMWLWGIDPVNNYVIFSLEDPSFVPSGCESPWLDYDLKYIEIGSGDADLIPYEAPQWKIDLEEEKMAACPG
jgi:hypothetical protein